MWLQIHKSKKAFNSKKTSVFCVLVLWDSRKLTLVNAIRMLCHNSNSSSMVDGHISQPFHVTTGFLQVDVLAPFWFIIMMAYILQRSSGTDSAGVMTHDPSSPVTKIPGQDIEWLELCWGHHPLVLEPSFPRARPRVSRTAIAAADLGLVAKTEFVTKCCNPQLPLFWSLWKRYQPCFWLPSIAGIYDHDDESWGPPQSFLEVRASVKKSILTNHHRSLFETICVTVLINIMFMLLCVLQQHLLTPLIRLRIDWWGQVWYQNNSKRSLYSAMLTLTTCNWYIKSYEAYKMARNVLDTLYVRICS